MRGAGTNLKLPGLTVFIPLYNEQALLMPNMRRLRHYLDSLGMPYEVILGSNGSTDATISQGRELARGSGPVRFFHLATKGVGRAFREGLTLARYERIVSVDMDLSIDLDFIVRAYRLLACYDIVVGSKITGDQKRAAVRKWASNLFIFVAKLLLKLDFHDYSIAAKGYRRGMARQYGPYIDDHTFYVLQLIHRANGDGREMIEIPVSCRDTRGSRFNLIYEGLYKFGNLFRLCLFRRHISTNRR